MQAQDKTLMPLNNTEERQQTRRSHRIPIAFFLNERKGDMTDYSFGWTKDVSPGGVCIHAKPNHIPTIDIRLTLLVASETQNRVINSDISVQIKGQVVWNDRENQNFGVRFI